MRLQKTIEVINEMERDGVISRYAVSGAIAAYNYIQPSTTRDVDVLVSFETQPGQKASPLISLTPVVSYLKSKGYTEFREEGVIVNGWPVQFLPVASLLDEEALAQAQSASLKAGPNDPGVMMRMLKPEHLIANALVVGRPKDHARIAQFVQEKAFNPQELRDMIHRFGLEAKWSAFCMTTLVQNPLSGLTPTAAQDAVKLVPGSGSIPKP